MIEFKNVKKIYKSKKSADTIAFMTLTSKSEIKA